MKHLNRGVRCIYRDPGFWERNAVEKLNMENGNILAHLQQAGGVSD
jgi:hypothetical protein